MDIKRILLYKIIWNKYLKKLDDEEFSMIENLVKKLANNKL